MAQHPPIPVISPDKWYYLQVHYSDIIKLVHVTHVGINGVTFDYLDESIPKEQRLGLAAFQMLAGNGAAAMVKRLENMPDTADRTEIHAVLTEGKYIPFARRRSHKLPHAIEPASIRMEMDGYSANVALVSTYAQADAVLTQWAGMIKHEYHENVRFVVRFADGQTYSGEYVLKAGREQSLGLSMYGYLTWHANIYFPTHRSADWLEEGEAAEIAGDFLKKYDIDSYNGVDALRVQSCATDESKEDSRTLLERRAEEISNHQPSRFIIGVQPVETLVIAGGEVLDYNDPRPLLVQIMAAKNMRRDENIGVLSEVARMDTELGRRAAALLEQLKQEGQ